MGATVGLLFIVDFVKIFSSVFSFSVDSGMLSGEGQSGQIAGYWFS